MKKNIASLSVFYLSMIFFIAAIKIYLAPHSKGGLDYSFTTFFNGFEVVHVDHMDSVSVFELSVPEVWYQAKVKTGFSTTYTKSSGILLIRKGKYNDSLLFKRSDSKNIFKWQYPEEKLQKASQTEWNDALDEVNLYTKANAVVMNTGVSASGKKILSARVEPHFTDIISFTGEIKEGTGGLLTSKSNTFNGTAFIDIFSTGNKLLLSIKQKMRNFQTIPYHEAIRCDSRKLIVPNDDFSKIIIAKF